MVKISLSFACGVLLAMLTNRHLTAGTDTAYMLCSGVLLSSIGCMAALATGRGRAGIQSMAAAFFAGAFCFLSRSICACSDSPALFQGALSAFSAAIDNAGFASEQTPALLKALLCGNRSALDRETIAAFRGSGASHILALSGLHLGVISVHYWQFESGKDCKERNHCNIVRILCRHDGSIAVNRKGIPIHPAKGNPVASPRPEGRR